MLMQRTAVQEDGEDDSYVCYSAENGAELDDFLLNKTESEGVSMRHRNSIGAGPYVRRL